MAQVHTLEEWASGLTEERVPSTTYPFRTEPAAPVLGWRDGAVTHLRFNRPEVLNALDLPTALAFRDVCAAIAADREVRAVVMSGAGRAFVAGGDVQAMAADSVDLPRRLVGAIHEGLTLLATLDAPLVAQVQGAVAGAGLGLMLACDLAVAADNVRLAFAYPQIGASADCGTAAGLVRTLGLRRALQVALLGRPVDAQTALQWGLVNEVVAKDQLAATVESLAARLAAGPTKAFGDVKRLMRGAGERNLPAQLQAEAASFLRCAATADFQEGLSAFVAKRPPVFRGS